MSRLRSALFLALSIVGITPVFAALGLLFSGSAGYAQTVAWPKMYPPNEIYRPRPNEAYNPSTYCMWNRTGIPAEFQKVCATYEHRSGSQAHKPRYVSIEAANGAVTKVDLNSIQRGDNAAIVFTYEDEGRPEDAYNLQGYMFDCKGHYERMTAGSSPMMYAPPHSVVGRISEMACSAPIGTVPK